MTQREVAETQVVDFLLKSMYGFPFKSFDKHDRVKCAVHRISQRFVGMKDVAWVLRTSNVMHVKSPMGSGKTTMFLELLNSYERVLILSSRRSYSDYMCTVVPGLVNYQEVNGSITADKYPRIIIQVQSLRRIKNIKSETTFAQWDMVYIDEPHSVFQEVVSGVTSLEERRCIPAIMRRVVSNIPTVIITDAGLAPWHIRATHKYLLSSLSNRSQACFVNERMPANRRVKVFDSCLLSCTTFSKSFIPTLKKALGKEDSMLMDAEFFFMSKNASAAKNLFLTLVARAYTNNSSNGTGDIGQYLVRVLTVYKENAVVVCNTKAQALMVADFLKSSRVLQEDEIVLLTGDTSADIKNSFMLNPQAYLTNKRCLVHTTCISVGVDLNFEWAKQTFLIVDYLSSKHTPTVMAMFQAMGRCRKSTETNVFVQGRRNYPSDKKMECQNIQAAHISCVLNKTTRLDATHQRVITEATSGFGVDSYCTEFLPGTDEDDLEAAVAIMNKLERSCNGCPRMFSDVILTLMKRTFQEGDTVYRGSLEWEKSYKFLAKESDAETAVDSCRKLFTKTITKYTTMTLTSFSDMFRETNRKDRETVLNDILSVLHLFTGNFASAFSIIRRLDKDTLKKWAAHYKKLQFVEPSGAVDLMNYDSEVSSSVDADALIDKVTYRLFKNNREITSSFQDFKECVAATHRLMDTGLGNDNYDAVQTITRALVDEYEIQSDRESALKAVATATGLVLYKDNCGDLNAPYRLILPQTNLRADIHKMCAMLLL